ncbi:hypothetical protein L596_023585 [Steinernema carpocapsae]|nr:hypothetical protein L596_023585 [Steinernema carpocapsae]
MVCQNYKLKQSLKHRDRLLESMRKDVDQYRKRQNQDDSMLCIINRCWNRFDDDVRLLLQRFDADASTEDESRRDSSAVKNFLLLLSQWEFEEIEPKMLQRVEFSRRALKKLIQAFERLNQRNKRLTDMITGKIEIPHDGSSDEDNGFRIEQIPEEVRQRTAELTDENRKTQKINMHLQSENHKLSMKLEAQDELNQSLTTKNEELMNNIEELQFQLDKSTNKEIKLESRLYDVAKQLEGAKFSASTASATASSSTESTTSNGVTAVITASPDALKKIEDLTKDLEAAQKVADNRLKEINSMLEKNKTLAAEVETLRITSKHIDSSVVMDSAEYRLLQTQYGNLLSEMVNLKSNVDFTRSVLQNFREESNKNLDDREKDEQNADERNTEVLCSLEDQMNAARRDYEALRTEFEQNLSGTDHTSPAAKELKAMVTSMKTMNEHLKQEAGRFKRKWKETLSLLAKAHKDLEQERKHKESGLFIDITNEDESSSVAINGSPSGKHSLTNGDSELLGNDEDLDDEPTEDGNPERINVVNKKLRARLTALRAKIDAYTALPHEKRELAEILSKEARYRRESEVAQRHLRKVLARDRREKARFYTEEANRRIKYLEEQAERLKKDAASAKNEEVGLMDEMESIGHAFETMQEQNQKLIDQLKERDDANLKLMSEQIRGTQSVKKLKEESEMLSNHTTALQHQLGAQGLLTEKVEEREKMLIQAKKELEAQISMHSQAMEASRRKTAELSQQCGDRQVQLEKVNSQLSDLQGAISKKMAMIEQDAYKMHRLEEDKNALKRKLDHRRKMEKADNIEEALLEEIKEMKDAMKCPSCKVKQKDAILTKCFHVFCMDCLKTRYETRRRKCPKCNAAFGANDYRRVYIA